MVGSESRYQAFLAARGRDGLRRSLSEVAARDARIVNVRGKTYVNLASNDYLALRFHKALRERADKWDESYGVCSVASRLVTGNLDLFGPIEAKVAKLKKTPARVIMAPRLTTNSAGSRALSVDIS